VAEQPTDFRVTDATFVAASDNVSGLTPPALAEVAFAGRSNVGKSSLLNAMMQRKSLARTSSTPGCTRTINIFHVAVQPDLAIDFVDLPGYGYAKRSKSEKTGWGAMIEGYLRERPTLRAVVLLVDVRRGLEPDDRDLVDFMREPRVASNKPVEVIVVATKTDKLSKSERKPTLEALRKTAGVPVLGFSAVTGDGREELWKRIRHAVL
jgi:GTP-binding protein